MPEAALLAKISVQGAEESTRKVLAFSDTFDKAGDKVKTSGKKTKEALNGVEEGVSALNSGLGVLGLSAGVGTLISLGNDALQSANALEKTEATVRALSGSTDRYNEVLAQARQGQALYGGSLNDNLKALGSFVNLSNRTGIELSNIDNIARRLATVDPAQGIEGAATALREALSGSGAESLISLRDRFEIPKEAIAAMGAEGITAKEKVEILDKALNDLGISNDVLSNSTDTTAAAYDRFGSAVDNAKTAIGGFLQDALLPYIESATGLLGIFQGTEQGTLDYANAMLHLTGAGRDLTEGEQEKVLAIGRFLGIVPEATAATNDAAAATSHAASTLPPYIAYLQGTGTALDRVTAQLQTYQNAADRASDAASQYSLIVQQQERSLRDEQAAVDDANDAVVAQERVVRQAEASLRDEQAAIDSANDAVANQEKVVRAAEQALAPYTAAIGAAEDAVKRQERAIRDAEDALSDEKAAVKSAADAVSDQEDAIKDAEKQYGRYEESIDRANKRLDRTKDATDAAKEAFDNLTDGVKDAQREMDRLKGTPLLGSAEMQAQMDAIEDERTRLELALNQAKQRGASDGEIDALEKQIDALNLKAEELELADKVANDDDRRKIERFGDAVKEMSGDQILAALAKQQQQVDSLTKQMGPAEQAWLAAVEAQQGAERSVERAQRAYERYKDSLQPLRDELGLLKDRLDDANDALQTEDDKIQPLRDSLDGLKRNVDAARDAYDLANAAIDPQRKLLEDLKGRVDDARDAYALANVPIDAQRGILDDLKDKQQTANDKLSDAEKLLQPYYDKQQTLNDKLIDANLALSKQKELLDPVIKGLKDHADAATNDAKATNDAAAAQERYNDAIRAAPSWGSTPAYIDNGAPYRPGGATGASAGVIYNGIESDDPRPSQGGINSVVQGGTLGSTFDADRGALGVHAGLDLRVADGSPVHAPLDLFDVAWGEYTDTQRAGMYVQGTDRKGRRWYFGHLGSVTVKNVDFVPKGGVIGYVAAGMGHTHVQLQRIPAPAGEELIDPSAALEESALGANSVGGYSALDTDTAAMPSGTDAVRAVEDQAYVLEVAVDALASVSGRTQDKKLPEKLAQLKADFSLALQTVNEILSGLSADGVKTTGDIADGAGRMAASLGDSVDSLASISAYEHDADFNAGVDQLATDYEYFLNKLQDIASRQNQEGVDRAALLYEATESMMGIATASIEFMEKFNTYEGVIPGMIDWWGRDQRLFLDKLLDIAQYYQTDGVEGAAALFEAQQRTFAPVDAFFDLIARFNTYRGVPTTIIDWVFGDQRKVLDKLIDLTYYYKTEGVEAAADLLENTERTYAPIHATIDLANDLNKYSGINSSILDWWGGDVLAVGAKVVDVDYRLAGTADAAARLNTTLEGIREAMLTGMSLGDAVAGYTGGGQATAVFGEVVDFVDSVTDYFADIRSDGVRPAGLALRDQLLLIGETGVDALHEGLMSGIDSIYNAGRAAGEAYKAGFESVGGVGTMSTGGGSFWNGGGVRYETYRKGGK